MDKNILPAQFRTNSYLNLANRQAESISHEISAGSTKHETKHQSICSISPAFAFSIMGKVVEEFAPGLTDVWKLWRHCLCRFGYYPLFMAPLITCAAFMDLYSSTGCDFIRLDIGFVPINEVWPGKLLLCVNECRTYVNISS